ncbi:carbohydrate-binding protein [Rummeliibacillus pycnus]|uniref:carbohydrate-binding protein n=1 Tax=Rummeliibacillus pycnus TaxID=101070 RepID=UPI003D2B11CB
MPKTVDLVTDAGNLNGVAKVTWNVDDSKYDPTVKTVQTFTVNGTVTLPNGVENPENIPLTTSISVTVDAEAFIQAENYTSMNNVKIEDTNDIGGGQALGWIGADSWMEYSDIDIPSSGTYTLQYRVAVNKSAGFGITFIVDGVPQKTTTLSNSGGWQNWTTVSDKVTLTACKHTIRLQAAADGFNFNWFKILYQ